MLKNAKHIMENNMLGDSINTTLEYAKCAQVGVDCSIKAVYTLNGPGHVFKEKSKVAEYVEVPSSISDEEGREGWYLQPGTYMVDLNEGVNLSSTETGFFVKRSSLNRSGVEVQGCVYDPGFTTENESGVFPASVKMIVTNPFGFWVEKNARICQFIVAENEETELYNGQYQGGLKQSKLVKESI